MGSRNLLPTGWGRDSARLHPSSHGADLLLNLSHKVRDQLPQLALSERASISITGFMVLMKSLFDALLKSIHSSLVRPSFHRL